MKLRLAIASAAVALAAASTAGAVDVTASATATIVSPSTVAKTRDLDFGTIAKPSNGGTTTVTVNSVANATATPVLTGAGNGFVPTTGLAKAAQFDITALAGSSYPAPTATLSFPSAGANLTNIGAEAPTAASGTLGTVPGTGTDKIYVGGHFDITSSTTIATYTGTLTLTINFP